MTLSRPRLVWVGVHHLAVVLDIVPDENAGGVLVLLFSWSPGLLAVHCLLLLLLSFPLGLQQAAAWGAPRELPHALGLQMGRCSWGQEGSSFSASGPNIWWTSSMQGSGCASDGKTVLPAK